MRIEWARSSDRKLFESRRRRVRVLNVAAATKFMKIIRLMTNARDWNAFTAHPVSGFKQLGGPRSRQFSMRLTQRDRILFEVSDKPNTIRILKVGGRYE